jgi:hypothetical protein
MNIEEINIILREAEQKKASANSSTTKYKEYLEAKKLYRKIYNACISNTEIDNEQRDIISSVYKYEELDCIYSYQIKKKEFKKAIKTNSSQKEIVENILSKYTEESLSAGSLKNNYKDFKSKRLTVELQAYQPIANSYFEEEQYSEALYYYRRLEEVLTRYDISKLSDGFLISFNKNFHIIKFNISQCQIGILRQEVKVDQILLKQTIKGVLKGISETKNLLKFGYDATYEKGLAILTEYIVSELKNINISWKSLLQENNNDLELVELMEQVDSLKYNSIVTPISHSNQKQTRFLFYTHGFNTRGIWKGGFTETITEKAVMSNIYFIMYPWDYGT